MKRKRPASRRTVLRRMAQATAAALVPVLGAPAAETVRLEVGGGALEVEFHATGFALPQSAILEWVTYCARAVSNYMGRFPVRRALLEIYDSQRERGVGHGTSWGEPEVRCRVSIGLRTTAEDLRRDWVLTHEMLHFAFPSVPERHQWIEEGISTYVEPMARAAVGLIRVEQVWEDMVRDMPKGLPQAGDRGLDVTHTWGRTYWGGALYCLLADVGIRRATENRSGLREALRAINAAGGNIGSEWPLQRAIEIGDQATRGTVLADLYHAMAAAPHPVDLPGLWKELGVIRREDGIEFDDRAPLAALRRAMIPATSGA